MNNQRDIEYSKAFIGSILKTNSEIDTRIRGMIGKKDLKLQEQMNRQTKAYQEFPWLFKG